MGDSPKQTQTTQQQSVSQPWAPAVPAVENLLGNISGMNTSLTPEQQSALSNLTSASGSLPDYSKQIGNTANTLFSGGPNFGNILQGAYGNLENTLSPLANPANLNPMNTPGFKDALSTMNSDISNQVNGQFAAAGRDLSPANSTALARGLSQGEGGLISGQYNKNVNDLMNAESQMFGAGNTTAQGMQGFGQQNIANMLTGGQFAGLIPQLLTGNAQTQMGAANSAFGAPFGNLGTAESLLTPLAALGGQVNSSGTQTSQTQIPLWQQILGGVAGLGGTAASIFAAPAGGTSAAGAIRGLFPTNSSFGY